MSDNAPVAEVVAPVVDEVVTDVVQPEAEPDTPAPQAEETDAPAGEESQAEKTFTQAELDEFLAKKTAKLQRIRDQERNKRELAEREVARLSIPKDDGRPNPANYQDVEQYAEDVANWKLGQRDREETVVKERQSASSFETRAAELTADLADIPDFDEGKWAKLPISADMAAAIVDSDIGVKVAQHLYANPSEADRIAQLPTNRQIAEIGKLEERLSSVPKVSKAPAPINPISKGTAQTSRRLEDLPMDQYIAERKKQGARFGR